LQILLNQTLKLTVIVIEIIVILRLLCFIERIWSFKSSRIATNACCKRCSLQKCEKASITSIYFGEQYDGLFVKI